MRRLERFFWSSGLLLALVYVVTRGQGSVMEWRALQSFAAERAASTLASKPEASVDKSLWSPQRIRAYEETSTQSASPALAVLRIPKIHLEVPVLDGTDELSLTRGVGRIEGTARPGNPGNVGIAGHRDGFFRGLKDVAIGDELLLDTRAATEIYRVSSVRIVKPDDVSVLEPSRTSELTLVTCYPFYYVGSAPQRYIVRAERAKR